jgi:RimJ/RimL family protein N-acetyltransferase
MIIYMRSRINDSMEKAENLNGRYIRLEPLVKGHAAGLVCAAASDISLYRWTPVPQGLEEVELYIQTALALGETGSGLAYAIVRLADGMVIGSTRFFNIERWLWTEGHLRYGRSFPDACEIGYSWLNNSAVRTAANTETKLLLLQLAFEKWQVFRVCFHTDVRNERSRAAIERIGGKMEGILRAHRPAVDQAPRDSARFSILISEWPDVKQKLEKYLDRQ